MWTSARATANQARIAGEATRAHVLDSTLSTGADVRFVSGLLSGDGPDLLILTGSLLQALAHDGTVCWRALDVPVTTVLAISDDRDGGAAVLALSGERRVLALDATDGRVTWEWTAPDGSNLSASGSTRLVRDGDRDLWLCFPTYSTTGHCFDLSNPRQPRELWSCDLQGRIDAGFGPVVVVGDVLGAGSDQVVLSSRLGSAYGGDDSDDVPSDQLVVGREDGKLCQLVLDLHSGAILSQVAYRPDPGPYPCARPYGLLQVAPLRPGASPDIVLASCQVEEYVSVTSSEGGLARRWGWFVERDWPTDLQELRPQVTSLADVRGDGRPLLVVGHWDGDSWTTLLIDPMRGMDDGPLHRLPGRYFWGCADLDGDGVAELIVSTEARRIPAPSTVLEVVDARTLEVIDSVAGIGLVTSGDSELPRQIAFHALRRSPVVLDGPDGRAGLVLTDGRDTVWWSPSRGAAARRTVIRPAPAQRIDLRRGRKVLTDDVGLLHVLDADLAVTRVISVLGSSSQPLTWQGAGGAGIVTPTFAGTVELWQLAADGAPRAVGTVPGRCPTLHVDARGTVRLASVRQLDGTDIITIRRVDADHGASAFEAGIDAEVPATSQVHDLLAFGDDFHLVVNRRTGVHTGALDVLDGTGAIAWSDDARGAHPNQPGAFRRRDGSWSVAYDDHGVLSVRDAATGELTLSTDWTAAYTTPMYVDLGDRELLIRCDGIHGIEALDLDSGPAWRTAGVLWEYFRGSSALLKDGSRAFLAASTRGGLVRLLDLADGAVTSEFPIGPQAETRPLLTIAGAAGDILVMGTADGDLVGARFQAGSLREIWRLPLGASVEYLAAVDDPHGAVVAASTADGRVRLVRCAAAR